ncbi:type II secretion system protein GspM [Pseudomonas sp. JR33AA]|uniref:type II secretion system protein GspM n=1 Tax=Pseudomonas sp. JR33AA TaxID=2899113 RepID=UPI001F3A3646|nr:type II secretion system protein GspM [Pseudomonas sp. JR33AA]MCE5975620.1 type II secretion system protein M [Pseudomonas sp. JR33AA]
MKRLNGKALVHQWQQLPAHRRTILTLVLWAVGLVVVWQLAWLPSQTRLRNADTRLAQEHELAALLKRVTQRQPQSAGTSEPFTPASLSERARLAGLQVAGLEARDGQLDVNLQGPPAAVLGWLHGLERDGGQVQRLQLQVVDEQLQVYLVMALTEG